MLTSTITFIVVLIVAVFASYKLGKLTLSGALTGGIIAMAIYCGMGLWGIAILAAFFILAVWATGHKRSVKQKVTGLRNESHRRDAGQVMANGAAAGIFALMICVVKDYTTILGVLVAASLASATADTISSELGTVYGKRFYNVLNLKTDEKGKDGVISLEGTLLGLMGACAIASIYSLGFGWSSATLYIIAGGVFGNLTDSVLGASLERKGFIDNDVVNFVNTVSAALFAWLLVLL
ncbi:DUF92 domain-containing protein [Mucilaginibacter pallidiroseus]|uniref:DUF92 domain-containing protein n=1 Tax=Mucilaginibacter pallidiroseus TaxID=2599295 RepID=A0A563UJ28_9SPHI|nr:DUF92 domain-containing protein [Mucilaginibacter pallidiroseus]TWR31296.1 DUF92 domain-containing protein [Mucilaginibacter pallidiroseus]